MIRKSWCPECGPNVMTDDDGYCQACKASAIGPRVDEANKFSGKLREIFTKEKPKLGKSVSRAEAIEISNNTMERAEAARMEQDREPPMMNFDEDEQHELQQALAVNDELIKSIELLRNEATWWRQERRYQAAIERKTMTENLTKEEFPGSKFDNGKAPMSLLPFIALKEVAKVLAFGANRYGLWNWAHGMDWSRIESAMLRHYTQYASGEDYDAESSLLHTAHLACNSLFLLTYQLINIGTDDRFKQK